MARRYFEKHKHGCYARQKRWREHAKERINARRREVYRLRKAAAAAAAAAAVPGSRSAQEQEAGNVSALVFPRQN